MEWQQPVSSFLAFSLTLQVQIAKPNFSLFFVFLIQPACLLSFAIDKNTFQPKLVDISLSLSQMWKCSVQRVECVLLLLPSSIDFKNHISEWDLCWNATHLPHRHYTSTSLTSVHPFASACPVQDYGQWRRLSLSQQSNEPECGDTPWLPFLSQTNLRRLVKPF